MQYKPKIIKGKVRDTGYPIDGRSLYFVMWDYDRDSWRMFGWDNEDDEAVMQTMFQLEKEDGVYVGTLNSFTEKWKAGKWKPQEDYCFMPEHIEEQEVMQEEEKNDVRDKMIVLGFDLSPKNSSGIACLPLDENLNGDTQAKHPNWTLIHCPVCGRKCWKQPEIDRLQREKGVRAACTQCALEAGLVAPFKPNNTPHPAGNRETRRRAKHGKK